MFYEDIDFLKPMALEMSKLAFKREKSNTIQNVDYVTYC